MAPLSERNAPEGSNGRPLSRINSFKRDWNTSNNSSRDSFEIPWSPSPPPTPRLPRASAQPAAAAAAPAPPRPSTSSTSSSARPTPRTVPTAEGAAKRRAAIAAAMAAMASSSTSACAASTFVSAFASTSTSEPPTKKARSDMPWNASAAASSSKARMEEDKKPAFASARSTATGANLKKRDLTIRQKVILSNEQQRVLEMAKEGKSIFFTGSAGTGKSVLLREIIKALREKYKRSSDAVAVTASTGIAACNVGGCTLHSFSGCGIASEDAHKLAAKVRKNRKASARWLRTKVLIIDEVSMVDGDFFQKLSDVGKNIRKSAEPFGGLQLVVTGDFFQLPPVSKNGQPNFCFEAKAWKEKIDHTVNLRQVFRQKDQKFVDMLNEMRFGKLSQHSITEFRKLQRPLQFDDGLEPTELFTHRDQVERSNRQKMDGLQGAVRTFTAIDGGQMPAEQRDKILANFMAPKKLELKLNCQVMLIKNMDDGVLVNGSLGHVIAFIDEQTWAARGMTGLGDDGKYHEIELSSDDEFFDGEIEVRKKYTDQGTVKVERGVEVKTEPGAKPKRVIPPPPPNVRGDKYPLVRFRVAGGGTKELLCKPESWKVENPSGGVDASRSQVPLLLSWAMSIHKSQGQTLDRVKVDLTRIFEKGQAYVALSRATSLEGLECKGFDPSKVLAHPKVTAWSRNLEVID